MRLFPLLFLFSLLTACGGSGGSAVGSNGALLGTWQSNCYPDSGYYYIDTYIFNNDSYLLNNVEYTDINCNTASGDTDSYNGTYTVGLNVTATDGAKVTRITMEQINPEDSNSLPLTLKLVFRITGVELSMGQFEEKRTPELIPEIMYTKQSDDRQLSCVEQVVFGINISVLDSATREYNGCGASVIIKDSDFYKKIDNPDVAGCRNDFIFAAAPERKGRYDIIVQKDGFKDWYQDDVIVTANQCHVNSVSIDALVESAN